MKGMEGSLGSNHASVLFQCSTLKTHTLLLMNAIQMDIWMSTHPSHQIERESEGEKVERNPSFLSSATTFNYNNIFMNAISHENDENFKNFTSARWRGGSSPGLLST